MSILSFVSRFVSRPKPDPGTHRSFERQLKFEAEGIAANNDGKHREDCPYPVDTFEWNHWVYGWSLVEGERRIKEQGGFFIASTAEFDPASFNSTEPMSKDNKPSNWGFVPTGSGCTAKWKPKYLIEPRDPTGPKVS